MRLRAVVLALPFSIILRAQEPHRIDGSPFPYSLKPDSVYVVYDNNFEGLQIGNMNYEPNGSNGCSVNISDLINKSYPENTEIVLLNNDNPSMVIIRGLLY